VLNNFLFDRPCYGHPDRVDKLYRHFTNGLPLNTMGGPKKIIIIGAGISGLMAGQMLKDVGHEVVILEASNRVGGRIQTYRLVTNANVPLPHLNCYTIYPEI
jgi:NADPH-dependent 2,4-dienoyl-CoA reductase/sulfur reductase-like enzyme